MKNAQVQHAANTLAELEQKRKNEADQQKFLADQAK